jgi:hypothetical protein
MAVAECKWNHRVRLPNSLIGSAHALGDSSPQVAKRSETESKYTMPDKTLKQHQAEAAAEKWRKLTEAQRSAEAKKGHETRKKLAKKKKPIDIMPARTGSQT